MLNVIGDSLRDHASSDNREDVDDKEDNEEDTELGKLTEDDELGWVMGTISRMLNHRMERFQQKQMNLDESTQPGWEDAANFLHERY